MCCVQYMNVLAPVVTASMLLMTFYTVQVVFSEEIDCHNLSWLVMSTTGVVLAGQCFVYDVVTVLGRLLIRFRNSCQGALRSQDE